MDALKISLLIEKYNAGEAEDEELAMIENLLEKGVIDLMDLNDVTKMEAQVHQIPSPSPAVSLDDKFYEMLAREKKAATPFNFSKFFSFDFIWPKLALAAFTFLAGLGIGYAVFTSSTTDSTDVQALSNEVKSLKEMMMLSLLEKESATERLKAVSMSQELDKASISVTRALIKTLNSDENANVRLAALEALKPYVGDSDVRKELIKSIAKQNSPLVQIALADLMASLQEKSSVTEFDKLLKDKKTPRDVKTRIRKSIEVLI